jgi:hypothetical protein
MGAIDIKKEQLARANPTQQQHHKMTVLPPSGGKKEETINVDETTGSNLKQLSESTEENLPSSFQVGSQHENTTTSDEMSTIVDTNC